jgi:enamine deaminase RidA (YjgF/YER057c/UK114 family)
LHFSGHHEHNPDIYKTSIGNYVSSVRVGNILHLSGHIPVTSDGLIKGKLGSTLTVQEGYQSARTCAINILATLQNELGTLDRVKRVVKIVGFVACTDDFDQQPSVINGASDFLVEVFGEKGHHARSAVGTNALPLGIATEVECIVEVEP